MYEYFSGLLKVIETQAVVLEVGEIGYRLFIPLSSFSKLPPLDSKLTLYTRYIVKEDSQTLYGFLSLEERKRFDLLTNISGVGPKTALLIIGYLEGDLFHSVISKADISFLSKIPGIGKKTAQRIILEMQDKCKLIDTSIKAQHSSKLISDAINALINLGYRAGRAKEAIEKTLQDHPQEKNLEKIITATLKRL